MDLKRLAALSACNMLEQEMIVGLGAGSTVAHMVEWLASPTGRQLGIQVLTSSYSTAELLIKNGITVHPISAYDRTDIYFDGCDQLDKNLNALKSGGGIHTMEKLLARMADQFILIGDESKLVEQFDGHYPIVLELLPQAVGFVPVCLNRMFPNAKTSFRLSDKRDGYVITDNGNYLLDLWLYQWPELFTLDLELKTIAGVVETSIFYNIASKAVIAGKAGIQILDKPPAT